MSIESMTSDSADFCRMEEKVIFNNTLRDRLILIYLNAVSGWSTNIKNILLSDSPCLSGTLDQILDIGKGSGTLDKILSLTTNSTMGHWLQCKHLEDGQKVIVLSFLSSSSFILHVLFCISTCISSLCVILFYKCCKVYINKVITFIVIKAYFSSHLYRHHIRKERSRGWTNINLAKKGKISPA